MTFFAVLLSLLIERLFQPVQAYRRFEWFEHYATWLGGRLGSKLWDGPPGVLAVILPVPLLLLLISSLLHGVFFDLFQMIFGVVILFLCLGPKDLDAQVQAFINAWEASPDAGAREEAAAIIGAEAPDDNGKLIDALQDAIMIQGNERIMAVVFWFAVLGPMGAVLYRFACIMAGQPPAEGKTAYATAAQRLHDILAWIPSRLCILGYAITGSFVDAIHAWREVSHEEGNWQTEVYGGMVAAGRAAMQLERPETKEGGFDREIAIERIKASVALVWRTVITWLAVLALMMLSGWVS